MGMVKEQVRCPYCHEYVTVDNRRWPLGDHSARLHLKRCPFSPIKVRLSNSSAPKGD